MQDNIIEFPLNRRENNSVVTGFYTPRDAARLARLPRPTLTEWASKGIVVPDIEWTDDEDKQFVGYSFKALVFVRLIRMLRDKHAPLRKVVAAVKYLAEIGDPGPGWAHLGIFTGNGEIWIDDRVRPSDDHVIAASRAGQTASVLLLGPEFELLRERADALLIPTRWQHWVAMRPELRNGMPVVVDTAIETATIHKLRQRTLSYDQILEYYPFLTRQQAVRANAFESLLDQHEQMAA